MHRQAYVLLLLTTLFWGGNAVAGKLAVGHISPLLLNFTRWGLAFAILYVVGRKQLAADWPAIRPKLPLLRMLGALGFTIYSVALYSALLHLGDQCQRRAGRHPDADLHVQLPAIPACRHGRGRWSAS